LKLQSQHLMEQNKRRLALGFHCFVSWKFPSRVFWFSYKMCCQCCHLILNEGVSQHNFLIRHLHRLEKRLQSVALRVRRQNVDHLSRLRRPALGRLGLTFHLDKNLEDSFRSCRVKDFQVRQDVVQVWNKTADRNCRFSLVW